MIAVIGEETGCFNAADAMGSIETKMIRRHPHVFGGSDVGAVEEVLSQWERIKASEKSRRRDSLMDDLPSFYSALKRADHVQKTAAGVGFDWPDSAGVIEKIEEEVAELREALAEGDNGQTGAELGDLLFSCINLARFEGLDAETLLNRTVDTFIKRFKYVESELRRAGKSPEQATLDEMDALWEQAKTKAGVPDAGNEE
jgi:MazG family protein